MTSLTITLWKYFRKRLRLQYRSKHMHSSTSVYYFLLSPPGLFHNSYHRYNGTSIAVFMGGWGGFGTTVMQADTVSLTGDFMSRCLKLRCSTCHWKNSYRRSKTISHGNNFTVTKLPSVNLRLSTAWPSSLSPSSSPSSSSSTSHPTNIFFCSLTSSAYSTQL